MLAVMELAALAGRLHDWEALLDELQPRQLRVLQVFLSIRPQGERRADLRSAAMAANTIDAIFAAAGAEREPTDGNLLVDYLGFETEQPTPQKTLSPMQMANALNRIQGQ